MLIKTVQEVNNEIQDIDDVLVDMYKTSSGSLDKIFLQYPDLKNDLQTNNVKLDDIELVKEHLLHLRLQLKNLERLKITVPFSPSADFLDRVVGWFHTSLYENKDANFVLDVDVKPGLLAGVTVDYLGKYRDYSAKSSIDKYFSNYRSLHELLS